MLKPKLTTAYQLIAGLLFLSIIIMSCGGGEGKKEESTEKKADTTKMDTASTRPVQPGN